MAQTYRVSLERVTQNKDAPSTVRPFLHLSTRKKLTAE